jgi:hypothetical protein
MESACPKAKGKRNKLVVEESCSIKHFKRCKKTGSGTSIKQTGKMVFEVITHGVPE